MYNSSVLLVEGNDDEHVFKQLFIHYGIPQQFEVINAKSLDNVLEQVPVRLKQAGILNLGIVMDADEDFYRIWNRVIELVLRLGFEKPVLNSKGTIVKDQRGIRLGVWIMPNNTATGALEDFLQSFVPQCNPLWGAIDKQLTEYERNKWVGYVPNKRSKALIHSWLSCQRDPGTPLGLAIKKQYLNPHNEQAQFFISWINELFFDKSEEPS